MGNVKNTVQSVFKAFAAIRAFEKGADLLTISEIASRADLDRGTAYRLIHTLKDLGYVAAVPNSKRFRLTIKCLELGYVVLSSSNLKVLSRPLLEELVAEVCDAASLGMLDGNDVVYVERVQSRGLRRNHHLRFGTHTGIYASALGQAILAFEPLERQREVLERSEMVPLSERTITDVDQLLARFAEIRERGWASSDGENAFGLRTVAVPIFEMRGHALAAVSATIQAERASMEDFVAAAVPRVLAAAKELSYAVHLSFGEILKQKDVL